MAQQRETRRDSAQASDPITKSDSTQFQQTIGLYVGTSGGNLVVVHPFLADGSPNTALSPRTIPNAPVGYHPLSVIMVMSTGTGVSDIVALY